MHALRLAPLLLLSAACERRLGSDVADPVLDLGAVFELVGDDPATIFLQALIPTSGAGGEALLDGDAAAGWSPAGEGNDEGVTLRFETERPLDAIAVRACDDSPDFRVQLYLDGQIGPAVTLSAGGERIAELSEEQGHHGVQSVFLRLEHVPAGRVACVAGVAFREEGRWLSVRPPRAIRGRIEASATRAPAGVWSAAGLVDGRLDTAWAEGGEGLGIGERVRFTLDEPAEIVGVEIWNGDGRSEAARGGSGRLLRLRIEPDGGDPLVVDVRDESGFQLLRIPAITTSALSLVIDGAIAGVEGEDAESVAIAEIRLRDQTGPIAILTPDAEERRAAWAESTTGQPVAAMVEREWRSVCGYPRRTLKLRPNDTFSRYDPAARWDDVVGTRASVAFEGTWYATGAEAPWTTLRLAGRRHRVEGRWQPADAMPASEMERDVAGEVQVAFVGDLGEVAFRDLMSEWGRGPAADRVDCVTEELGAWPDAWAALVANHALVVRGGPVTDLVWGELR